MSLPHMIKILSGIWINPAHVVSVKEIGDLVVVTMIDGSSQTIIKHHGSIIYNNAEAIISHIASAVAQANGE